MAGEDLGHACGGGVEKGWVEQLRYSADGLIPVVVQDARSRNVLMLAYANEEAVGLTLRTGRAWFYSRSRRRLWQKGETSGNYQEVEWIRPDCDSDALLVGVKPAGPACHTGAETCFFSRGWERNPESEARAAGEAGAASAGAADGSGEPRPPATRVLDELWAVICSRRDHLPEGSYTASLFRKPMDSALKKVTEEAGEFILACKAGEPDHAASECADLWFHTMVALARCNVDFQGVLDELAERRGAKNRP